jgi:hypothetical protein
VAIRIPRAANKMKVPANHSDAARVWVVMVSYRFVVPPRAAGGREGAMVTKREVVAFSAPEKNRTSAHGLGNHCSIH